MVDKTLEKLFDESLNEAVDELEKKQIRELKNNTDEIAFSAEFLSEEHTSSAGNLFSAIEEMGIPQKIKLALYGNKSVRTILIRETDRRIPLYVLKNPRITDEEVLEISKNSSLASALFREITNNSAWIKSYAVKLAIVSNPKAPTDVTLPLVKYMQDRDLRRLAKSKNIPFTIVTHCRKILEERSK